MMTFIDVLGKIAWIRLDFLSQGKISDILIRNARNNVMTTRYITFSAGTSNIIPIFETKMQICIEINKF